MPIVINGSGTVTGITGITGTNATVTGITSVASNSASTPVVLQDSGSNTNTCRAWVNFDGTGTVAIRGSFNVSSITDGGTGIYTVNFITAMPDANYSTVANGKTDDNTTAQASISTTNTYATSSVGVRTNNGVPAAVDFKIVSAAVFR